MKREGVCVWCVRKLSKNEIYLINKSNFATQETEAVGFL